MHAHGWSQVVIKPVIGTSSREAQVVSFQTVEAGQRHLSRLLSREAVMVQPFLPAFYAAGERSLIFINGAFTHAIRSSLMNWKSLNRFSICRIHQRRSRD